MKYIPSIPRRLDIPWECLALVLLVVVSAGTGLSLAVYTVVMRYSDHDTRAEAKLSSYGDYRSYAAVTDAIQCAPVTRYARAVLLLTSDSGSLRN